MALSNSCHYGWLQIWSRCSASCLSSSTFSSCRFLSQTLLDRYFPSLSPFLLLEKRTDRSGLDSRVLHGYTIALHLGCGCQEHYLYPRELYAEQVGCRYSTMDNVDGKQARRTGTSSGLGELFEYGSPRIPMSHMTNKLIATVLIP
jgi:CDP-alcohol phosphatidyltransferase